MVMGRQIAASGYLARLIMLLQGAVPAHLQGVELSDGAMLSLSDNSLSFTSGPALRTLISPTTHYTTA